MEDLPNIERSGAMRDSASGLATGRAVLNDPIRNKGTAFSIAERIELGIEQS